jgi:hypothetical protein
MEEATWMIEVNVDGVMMTRMHDGKSVEAYRRVDHRTGAVYAAAITQGFQPPRNLMACGKPMG